jgi:hypothetical protein
MARRLLGTLPLALGLLIAACADQNDSSPTAPHASGGPAAKPVATGCNFSGFSSLIAQYFTTSGRQQTASGFVNDMQTGGQFSTGAIDGGFNLLALIARTVDSTYNGLGTSGPAATGSSLAQATIRCMYNDLGTLPDFTVSVDPASKGAFQVVGGASDATNSPVLARTDIGSEPISAVAPTPPSNWGAIVKTADGTAFTRALIYGKPVLTASDPPSVDPLQYQWEAIRPDISFAFPGAVVAICAAQGTTDWIQESGLGILAYQSAADLCVEHELPTVGFLDGGWRPSLLARRLVRFMSPEPLSAAVALKSTGGTAGGLKSIFSNRPVSSAALKFIAPTASRGPKNTPIAVTVQAKADGTLMNGVTVTLTGTNNNGQLTQLVQSDGTSCSSATPPTGITGVIGSATGQVTIYFCVTKNGGLTLTGNGDNDGRPNTSFTAAITKLNITP